MRMRNLVLFTAILLISSLSALAQRTPPPPSAPPAPEIIAPVPPPEPMAYSLYFDGMNYLGVLTEEIDRENMGRYGMSSPRGVGISRVTEGSPAEKAGLKKGDVILQFDSEPVTNTRKLFRLIGEASPGQAVRLTISRGGSEQQVNVSLGQREESSRVFRTVTPPVRGGILRGTPMPRVWSGEAPEALALGFGNNRRVGITTTQLTRQLADFFGVQGGHGILITSVSENSPASRAGLRAGDVITEVNNEKVEDAGDFIRALNFKEEGDVNLTIIRDKSQRTIKVTPERRETPTFNFSQIAPAATLSQMTIPAIKVEIPEMRLLQAMPIQSMPKFDLPAMPKFEFPAMPKMDLLTLPQFKDLQRLELLQPLPCIL